MKKYTANSHGFTLIVILVMSTALMVLALAMLQTISLTRADSLSHYYTRLAEEAGEAGAAYAQSCLELNQREQTWGPSSNGGNRPNLTPARDCNGATNSPTTSSYVFSDTKVQSAFSVGDLEVSEDNSAVIKSTGTTEVKNSATGVVLKTYTHIVKKTIVWSPELEAQQSSSGLLRTCAILSGNGYCWGDNTYGQLGNGTTNDSLTPVKVERLAYPGGIGDHEILDITSGGYTNCILIDTGEVYCWGQNDDGELGIGSTSPSQVSTPTKVTGLSSVTVDDLGNSSDTMCAITTGNALYCWGSNSDGQVGNNSSSNRTSPILIGGPTGGYGGLANKSVSDISPSGAFNNHICAVAQGLAYCWGRNTEGQLGNNPSGGGPWADQRTPVAVYTGGVLSGKTVVTLTGDGSGSDAHTCAMAYTTAVTDMRAYCWGSADNGFLGNGASSGSSKVPVAVSTSGLLSGKTVAEVAVSGSGACVTAYPTPPAGSIDDSRAYCWGTANGRGDGVSSNATTPVQVDDTGTLFSTEKIYSIVGGAYRFCAIALNKSYCWGVNTVGQIGDGTTSAHRRQPTESLFLRPNNNEYIF